MTITTDLRRGLLLATAALALTAMTGCDGKTEQQHDVATLVTPKAGAPAPKAGAAEKDRPRYRLDMTEQEKDRLIDTYNQCLHDHGMPKDLKAIKEIRKTPAKVNQIHESCKAFDPLPPWEYDAKNPQARDNVHKIVLCLRAHGVKIVTENVGADAGEELGFSLGGPGDDSGSITKGMELGPVCEKQILGGTSR